MAKYLFMGKYTPEGMRGLKMETATARRDAVSKLASSLGGRLESFYFGFGRTDTFTIFDLPSNEAAAAVVLAVNSSGGAMNTTTVLLEPEEMDASIELAPEYRPPGATG